MQKKKNKKVILLLLLPVAAAVLFLSYTGRYYRADDAARRAMEPDAAVLITKTDYGFFFDGPSKENTLIFYPGGKGEETAYAPLLHGLAREGVDVCLVKMPLRIAFLSPDKAAAVMRVQSSPHWYIGGHSLGGAVASVFAASHPDAFDGVFFLASYPMKDLGESLPAILVNGSEDEVLDRERYSASLELLSGDVKEYVIQGANHAQFGSYGAQRGDGKASITMEEQVQQTVRIVTEAIQ